MRRTALLAPLLLAGCEGIQSALAPLGEEAGKIGRLLWTMTAGGTAILVLVLVLTWVALRGGERARTALAGERMVLALGVGLPAVLLTALLAWGVSVMASTPGAEGPDEGTPRLRVTGLQWWWRVEYLLPDGTVVEAANEVHLPAGRRVALDLASADVIHSFWVPALAGKLDMIPGRTNTLTLLPTEPAATRGQCAEYCGGAHALMSFWTVSEPPEAFDAWLAREATDARPPATPEAERGAAVFAENGCGACHTVRGTDAAGRLGPDLTHVGSRRSLAAGVLPNTPEDFALWVERTRHVKPQVHMPSYPMLPPEDLRALGLYLDGLE